MCDACAGISEEEHEELKAKPQHDFLEYVSSVIENNGDINEKDEDGATLVSNSHTLHSAVIRGVVVCSMPHVCVSVCVCV